MEVKFLLIIKKKRTKLRVTTPVLLPVITKSRTESYDDDDVDHFVPVFFKEK